MEIEVQGVKYKIPRAPEVTGALAPLPESKQREWREIYVKGLKQAVAEHPGENVEQFATREANRMLRVEEPQNYDEAMKLELWQLMKIESRGTHLHVVTIGSHGCNLPIPRGTDASADIAAKFEANAAAIGPAAAADKGASKDRSGKGPDK